MRTTRAQMGSDRFRLHWCTGVGHALGPSVDEWLHPGPNPPNANGVAVTTQQVTSHTPSTDDLGINDLGLHQLSSRREPVAPSVIGRPETAISLTRREAEVARLVVRGRTNRQIAAELMISERTAERHMENLRIKLKVTSRAQIAAWAAGRDDGA